jgi:hypothetical protein
MWVQAFCAYNISWAKGALPGSKTNLAMGIMTLLKGSDGEWCITMQVDPMPADMTTYLFETNFDGSQDPTVRTAAAKDHQRNANGEPSRSISSPPA